MAEGEDSLRSLLLKVADMTAERNEWNNLATGTTKTLKAAEADFALQSTLCEAAWE